MSKQNLTVDKNRDKLVKTTAAFGAQLQMRSNRA